MNTVGGRITITLNGKRFSPRGKATIRPAQVDNQAQVNHDGTVSRTMMAKAATAEMTFDRGAPGSGFERPRWDGAFMAGTYDVSILEKDAKVLHIFSAAFISGEPAIDTETGEVSGLTIVTDSYQQA